MLGMWAIVMFCRILHLHSNTLEINGGWLLEIALVGLLGHLCVWSWNHGTPDELINFPGEVAYRH